MGFVGEMMNVKLKEFKEWLLDDPRGTYTSEGLIEKIEEFEDKPYQECQIWKEMQ